MPAVNLGAMKSNSIRILHLTDTHISAGGALHYGVDTCGALRRVLERAASASPHVVVVSGDVSDDGSVESYRLASDMVHEWADARGAAVVWAMGNHDGRSGFRQVLCSEPGQPDQWMVDQTLGQPSDGPIFGRRTVAGIDILLLDTAVPGRSYGHVDPVQLDWLQSELNSRTGTPAVLVMHHPLVPAQTDLLNGLALDNAGQVRDLLTSSRVKAVLSGHYHALSITPVCAGITAVVGAPVTAQGDSIGDPHHEVALRGAGACIVDVRTTPPAGCGDVTVLPFHVCDPQGNGQLSDIPPSDVARIIAQSGMPADATRAQ